MTDLSDPSAMSSDGQVELELAIEDLQAYRQRLVQDLISMGHKLKLPQAKVDRDLNQHPEIRGVDQLISQLTQQHGDSASPAVQPADPDRPGSLLEG